MATIPSLPPLVTFVLPRSQRSSLSRRRYASSVKHILLTWFLLVAFGPIVLAVWVYASAGWAIIAAVVLAITIHHQITTHGNTPL